MEKNTTKENISQSMIIYREVKRNEIKEIAKLVANSFGEYPMYTFCFRDKFKNKEDFINYMIKLNKVHICANAKKHKCFVGVVDKKIVSVSLLQNPNIKRISLFDYILAGGIKLLFPVGLKRLISFFNITNEAHIDCATKYSNSWYVELLAVSKDNKGQGIGSNMINDCLIPYIKCQKGTEISLITNTLSNTKFYLANGFTNFAVKDLTYKESKIQCWSFYKKI